MANWTKLLRAALPHASKLAAMALPAFTARRDADTAQQIEELQAAARSNAEGIKILAEELEKTVAAIDAGGEEMRATVERLEARILVLEAELRGMKIMVIGAVAIAVCSIVAAVYILVR